MPKAPKIEKKKKKGRLWSLTSRLEIEHQGILEAGRNYIKIKISE